MADSTKNIYVYADWIGLDYPHFMGTLTANQIRGKEIFSFQYDDEWLKSGKAKILDPDLSLFSGFQHLRDEKLNFGMFLDSHWHSILKIIRLL